MCTLQLCVRCLPRERWKEQPRPVICFRGKPKNPYFNKEKEHYDKRVDVMFQPKAWFDSETCLEYVNTTLTKCMLSEPNRKGRWLLIMDSLHGQKTPQFRNRIRTLGGRCHFGPARMTDDWQVYTYFDACMRNFFCVLREIEKDIGT